MTRRGLYGRFQGMFGSLHGTIGLCYDEGNLVARLHETFEAGNRSLRGTEKNNSQSSAAATQSPFLILFRMSRLTISRLSAETLRRNV